jgi:chaperone BCS1
MPIVSVRFNHGLSYHHKIFIQPLFYLSEQIRQYLYKNGNNSGYNKSKVDDNISFTDLDNANKICLEVMPAHNWTDLELYYYLNRYNTKLVFSYKNKKFGIVSIPADNNIVNKIIMENRDDFTMYSSYEINYNSEDIEIFESFIKTSITFYEKYSIVENNNKDSISIYITSQEGFYFQSIGKRNKRPMDSIHLPKKQKQDIITDLEKFLKPETKKRYNQLGINYKRTYLLEGIPGTGKTSLITGLASKFNASIAIVSFIPKMTDVDLIRSLRTLKDYDDDKDDSQNRYTFLVFEDIDCIFKERKSNDESRNSITFSGLLNALDGITTNDLICFITTNYKHNLDSALLRPGRVDYIMRFDYAVKEQIMSIYKDFTSSQNDDEILEFYNECSKFNNIKITTALLQQYLMKYIDNPRGAIDNIDEMKTMFEVANVAKEADESGLYS